LRTFEIALTTVSKRWERHPEMGLSQCRGTHEFRYRIYPHAGEWSDSEIFQEAECLALPLEPAQAGAHKGNLPKRHSFLAVEPANLILSAVKRAEDGAGLVVRVYNPTPREVAGVIRFGRAVQSAQWVSLEEEVVETLTAGDDVAVILGPKKIGTLKVVFK
jgi:alpha-mannosidase